MAAGVNKVIIVGNLGRDPEVRYSQSGNAVCKLNIAVTERQKVGDKWEDRTEWVRCVLFGKTAENAGQYLQKGRQIYVEGRLQTSSYKDKESGVEKYATEVIANQLLFLGQGGGEAKGDGAPHRQAPRGGGSGGSDAPPPPDDSGFIDDDLPFVTTRVWP